MKFFGFIILVITFYASDALERIISVQIPPRIMKQSSTDEILFLVANPYLIFEQHVPVAIECEAAGNPKPEYRWTKNGKEFNYANEGDRISIQPGRGTLVIEKPHSDDAGQYQCFVTNDLGTATSNSVFLRQADVNFKFVDQIQRITVYEGDSFNLSCSKSTGYPKIKFEWVTEDKSQGLFNNISNPRITSDPEGTLWFSNITINDAKNDFFYKCLVPFHFRHYSRASDRFEINVIPVDSSNGDNRREPLKQYVSRKNEIAYRGKSIELFCVYGGTPLPEIIWSKNDERIKTSENVKFGNYGKSLMINDVDFKDMGVYSCEAFNGIGRNGSHSIRLQVLSTPFLTVEPKSVNAAENETIILKCEADGVPQPSIQWIRNGKPVTGVLEDPRQNVTENSFILENLTKQDTGNYGCNASNSVGYIYKEISINILPIVYLVNPNLKKWIAHSLEN